MPNDENPQFVNIFQNEWKTDPKMTFIPADVIRRKSNGIMANRDERQGVGFLFAMPPILRNVHISLVLSRKMPPNCRQEQEKRKEPGTQCSQISASNQSESSQFFRQRLIEQEWFYGRVELLGLHCSIGEDDDKSWWNWVEPSYPRRTVIFLYFFTSTPAAYVTRILSHARFMAGKKVPLLFRIGHKCANMSDIIRNFLHRKSFFMKFNILCRVGKYCVFAHVFFQQ